MTTILVVDDEKQVRDLVSEVLHTAGYNTIPAADGLAGIRMATEHRPDLIVLDVNMPRLNGFQMLEKIRSAAPTSTIPVIFLSAESGQPAMRKGMVGGADDFLIKPISPYELLTAVEAQLRKRARLEEQHCSTLRLLRKNIIYALPHELRTPLGIISGYARLLEMDQGQTKPDDVLQFAQAIGAASARLERLIENYLIYAQLELIHADSEELEAANNHLIRDCAPIISDAATERAWALQRAGDLRLELCHLAMRISEKNLAKIIFELVDNAFKFSEPGSPVEVRAIRDEDLLYVIIRDAGRGMTGEQIKLLGAYMQFGRELYEQQGLGLGFTVAKRLVELHRGAVRVDSRPGTGTRVTLRFPLS